MRIAVAATLIALVLSGCRGPDWNEQAPCVQCPGAPGQTVPVPATCPGTPGPTAVTPMAAPMPMAMANPLLIPIGDHQAAWEQVVDAVEGYFRIAREEPVRTLGNVVTEGTITTVPEVSPTIFEPWRHDTVDPDQRWENTLQTMRRRAVIRVIPAAGGHMVDVQVFKELEDNRHPEHATAGAATFRYDDSLERIVNPIAGEQITRGWISKGRDTSLEQAILADLTNRCNQVAQPMVR
jgi:hypothetical protein